VVYEFNIAQCVSYYFVGGARNLKLRGQRGGKDQSTGANGNWSEGQVSSKCQQPTFLGWGGGAQGAALPSPLSPLIC